MKHSFACPAGFQVIDQVPAGLGMDDHSDPSQQPALQLGAGAKHFLQLPSSDSEDEDLNSNPNDNPWAENPDLYDLYDAFTAFERRGA